VNEAVLRPGLSRILDRLCCPRCRTADGAPEIALAEASSALTCARCGSRYPVVSGVPDLRDAPGPGAESALDRRAVDFYERVYAEGCYGRDEQNEHIAPLSGWLAGVPEDAFVLELGPGRGALQDVHPGYVGSDLSIESLVTRLRQPAFASNAQNLPLQSGSVDFLFSVAVLEHIPDPAAALAEIARVISPGGRAYLAPAWNCRTWAAEGLNVRPYRDLSPTQRLRKATIPVRNSVLWRGAFAIPKRIARRALWQARRRPTRFRFRRLDANFEVFWASDSDATAQLDPHETGLYFESRGWTVESPPSVSGRVFHRAQPLVVRRSLNS